MFKRVAGIANPCAEISDKSSWVHENLSGKRLASKTKKRAVLVLEKGEAAKTIKLRVDATIIGREKGDVIVKDKEISSSHCQIQKIDSDYYIFDMNSSNGTFLNGEKTLKSRLCEGDVISLGQVAYRFMLQDESQVRYMTTVFSSEKKQNESGSNLVDTLVDTDRKGGAGVRIGIAVTYQNGEKQQLELKQKKFFIGRASSFGRFDQDPELSRRHLLVKLNNTGELFVEDQGSTNGSFINGNRIVGMQIVRPNDEVTVGSNLIRFSVVND